MDYRSPLFPVNGSVLVSPTPRDQPSSRLLTTLPQLNQCGTMTNYIDGLIRMEEAAAASRIAAHMAMAQLKIAQEQQALKFRRFPSLFNTMMKQQTNAQSDMSLLYSGLDVLGSAAMIQQKPLVPPVSQPPISSFERRRSVSDAVTDAATTVSIENSDSNTDESEDAARVYIDKIGANDVLCGRGGRSNHHVGNKRYRLVVAKMKYMYQQCPAKTMKTDLSRAIVKHCASYGARFVKLDESNGKYYILSKGEARKKTSQALRESKALKWIS